MGAFKQLNSQDIIVSPLEVNRGYTSSIVPIFSSSGGYSYISYGVGRYSESLDRVDAYGFQLSIERLHGKNDPYNVNEEVTGIYTKYKKSSIYNSTKQLYYTNYISGSVSPNGDFVQGPANEPTFNEDGTIVGDRYNTIFDNYRQTDLLENKTFPTGSDAEVAILSIPLNVFGDKVQPGSFILEHGAYSASAAGVITDDGEGRLISSGNVVGNIIYTHGIAVLTDVDSIVGGYGFQDYSSSVYGPITGSSDFIEGFMTGSDLKVSFSSSYTFYETQYKTTIGESEFNYSQNPTSVSGSDGIPFDFITGSYFSPYVTTVGLYNDAYELLAVGKLGKALPTSNSTDTNILINIDRH